MLPISNLSDISPERATEAEQLVAHMLQQEYPGVDFRATGAQGLLLGLLSRIYGMSLEAGDRLIRSSNLSQAVSAASAGTVDEAVATALLSNYGLQPQEASTATAVVRLFFDRYTPAVIPAGTRYDVDNVGFVLPRTVSLRRNASDAITSGDKLPVQRSDGLFSVDIDVEAVRSGSLGDLSPGANVISRTALPALVSAELISVSGGSDAETVSDLLDRARAGVAAPSWSHTAGIQRLLRDIVGPLRVSVVGAGDPSQLRDRRYGVSFGGRLDLWLAPRSGQVVRSATLSATYNGVVAGKHSWLLRVSRPDMPGVSRVLSISRNGQDCEILSSERTYNQQDGDPDIASALEAANSVYQELEVVFLFPRNNAETSIDCLVTGTVVSELVTVQAAVSQPDNRPVGGDCVVRAAVSSRVRVEVSVRANGTAVDKAAVTAAVAREVNTTPFAEPLYASNLMLAVSRVLRSPAVVQSLGLVGVFYPPDGPIKVVRADSVLRVPDRPDILLSPSTCAFVCAGDDVQVEVS